MVNEHVLVLGPSKAAKDQMSFEIKKAITKEENIIIVDPKGDLSKTIEKTLEAKNYKICTFDFAEKGSCHYDPLLLNTADDNAYLAKMMSSSHCNNLVDQDFWVRAMVTNLGGVMNYVQIKYADDRSKWTFVTAKEILRDALQNKKSEYLTTNPVIYALAHKAKTTVLSDSINIMDLFSKESLSNLLSDNDPIFDEINKEADNSVIAGHDSKYAIVVNFSPDDKAERILCNSLVSRLFAIFCNRNQNTVRKRTTHFFISDAVKLGKVENMYIYTSVGRGYNTYIDLSSEDIEQMEEVYGHAHTEIINANMNVIKAK